MRHSLLLMVLCLAVAIFGVAPQGDAFDNAAGLKRPLDLPAGGKAVDEDEEDQPETIVFYGDEFEGDCFVWCFPAYGFCGDTSVYVGIRAEIQAAVNQLSENAQFSLVGFNAQNYIWSPVAKAANASNKASAGQWMATLAPVETHCIVQASVAALAITQIAASDHKQLVICGARGPTCASSTSSALLEITSSNYQSIPIHTVYFSGFYTGDQAFYQQLANMNSGTYREVNY